MSTLAIYPGSFDPVTNGHVDIITRGARLFDRIVVAILLNAEKSPLFSTAERVEISQAVFKALPNVEVDTFEGLLVDYVERCDHRLDHQRSERQPGRVRDEHRLRELHHPEHEPGHQP